MDVTPTARQRPGIEADELSLGDYIELIWRYKTVVAGTALVAGVLAFWGSMVGARGYESTVTFAATQSKLGEGGLTQVSNTAPFRPMVESLTTAAAVIQELGLAKPPYNMSPSEFLDLINVTEVRGTNLITVKVSMADPALAAAIANSVAEHAVQTARRVSSSEVAYTSTLIKEQLDAARGRLDSADAQLRDYRQQARVEAVKKDLEARLGGPQSALFSPVISSVAKSQPGGSQTTVLSPVFVGDQTGTRQSVLDLLVKISSEKARLAVLDRDMAARARVDPQAKASDAAYKSMDVEAAAARANVASLEQQKAELTSAHKLDAGTTAVMDRLYAIESELSRRQVERDVAEKIFVDLAQRYQESRLQVIGKSAEFVIVDPAVPADRPTSRHAARNVAVAMTIWLSLAIAGVLMWDSVQRRRVTR